MSGLETLIELFYLLAVQDTQHDVARAGTRLLETPGNPTALPTRLWQSGIEFVTPSSQKQSPTATSSTTTIPKTSPNAGGAVRGYSRFHRIGAVGTGRRRCWRPRGRRRRGQQSEGPRGCGRAGMEVFADASPGLLATAAPTPSAMASAPTRPMYSGRPATPRRYVKLSHLVSDRDWTPVWFIDTRHPPVGYVCLAMRQITISPGTWRTVGRCPYAAAVVGRTTPTAILSSCQCRRRTKRARPYSGDRWRTSRA